MFTLGDRNPIYYIYKLLYNSSNDTSGVDQIGVLNYCMYNAATAFHIGIVAISHVAEVGAMLDVSMTTTHLC